jgi:Glycosyl transferase family 4
MSAMRLPSRSRTALVIAGVWAVNLTNFMDGIDWMKGAEVVPITAGAAMLALMGALPPSAFIVALALLGAIIGFAPFNRPVAKLFLGDVGSLPRRSRARKPTRCRCSLRRWPSARAPSLRYCLDAPRKTLTRKAARSDVINLATTQPPTEECRRMLISNCIH